MKKLRAQTGKEDEIIAFNSAAEYRRLPKSIEWINSGGKMGKKQWCSAPPSGRVLLLNDSLI